MNLILFNQTETIRPLPLTDARSKHILEVLKVQEGCSFDVGRINGPRGKATLKAIAENSLDIGFSWETDIPKLYEIDLMVSFCRPQTCRKILQECTSLGVRSLTFFDTEKSEPSYKLSSLWTTGEAEKLLIRGAEQAFCTRLPELTLQDSLGSSIHRLTSVGNRIALDNYESTRQLKADYSMELPVTIAIGGERGWSKSERDSLREYEFVLTDLGPRVLRTETACIAAVSIIKSQF